MALNGRQGEPRGPAHFWFAPLNTLPFRSRLWLVLLLAGLAMGWSALVNGDLMVAWGLPDVQFYVRMARGRYDLVPQPFSARPLAPLLARGISSATHIWVEGGFTILAYLALLWSLLVVLWLLSRSPAPRWVALLVASVAFWPQLLGYAGLPDPLYTALLATLLLALELDWLPLAALLMLPLMLARESTSLTLVCLLLVSWRQLRCSGSALAIGSAVAGALIVRHVSAGGLPNPEHLSGGAYMVGKVISNGLRSLGVLPWSNVYPELCSAPAWQMSLRLGTVRSVGFCSWSPGAPLQALWALLTTFGLLPILVPVFWRRCPVSFRRNDPVLRFALLYGAISLLLAPALGTWYARLFGYGWPLLLVALPRVLRAEPRSGAQPAAPPLGLSAVAVVLAVHLLIGYAANRMPTVGRLGAIAVVDAIVFALFLVQAGKHRHGLRSL